MKDRTDALRVADELIANEDDGLTLVEFAGALRKRGVYMSDYELLKFLRAHGFPRGDDEKFRAAPPREPRIVSVTSRDIDAADEQPAPNWIAESCEVFGDLSPTDRAKADLIHDLFSAEFLTAALGKHESGGKIVLGTVLREIERGFQFSSEVMQSLVSGIREKGEADAGMSDEPLVETARVGLLELVKAVSEIDERHQIQDVGPFESEADHAGLQDRFLDVSPEPLDHDPDLFEDERYERFPDTDDWEGADYEYLAGDLQDYEERRLELLAAEGAAEEEVAQHFAELAEREEQEAAEYDEWERTFASKELERTVQRIRESLSSVLEHHEISRASPDRVVDRAAELITELKCPRRVGYLLAQGEAEVDRIERLDTRFARVDHSALLTPFNKAIEVIAERVIAPKLDALLKDLKRSGSEFRTSHWQRDRGNQPARLVLGKLAETMEGVVAEATDAWPIPLTAARRELQSRSRDARRSGPTNKRGASSSFGSAIARHFGSTERMAWISALLDHIRVFYRNGFVHRDLATFSVATKYRRVLVGECAAVSFMLDKNSNRPNNDLIGELRHQSWFPAKASELPEMIRISSTSDSATREPETRLSGEWRLRWLYDQGGHEGNWHGPIEITADSVLEYSKRGRRCKIEIIREGARIQDREPGRRPKLNF